MKLLFLWIVVTAVASPPTTAPPGTRVNGERPIVFPRVSPDGRWWARTEPGEGAQLVVCATVTAECRHLPLPSASEGGVVWMGNRAVLVGGASEGLLRVDLVRWEVEPFGEVAGRVVVLAASDDAATVLVRGSDGTARMDTIGSDGRVSRRFGEAGFLGWVTSDQSRAYIADIVLASQGGPLLLDVRPVGGGRPVRHVWTPFSPAVTDDEALWMAGWSRSGYLVRRIDRFSNHVVLESPAPVVGLSVARGGELLAVATESDRIRWSLGGPPAFADMVLDQVAGDVVKWQFGDDYAVAEVQSPSDRGSLWIADVRGARRLWSAAAPGHAGTAELVSTRSGEVIPAVVLRPDDGPGPWPTIVWLHGGPWNERNHFAWDDQLQRFADLGYAVVAPNFHGSSVTASALRKSGRGLLDTVRADVEDTARWAVDQGVAAPGRLAVAGVSFGGMMALDTVTGPAGFTCAVSIDGPSALVGPEAHHWPASRKERRVHSPLHHVSDPAGPVLLLQGSRDDVVEPGAAVRFARAAEEARRPVTLVVVPRGGHSPSSWPLADRVAAAVVEAQFLAGCLGGRAEGWDAIPPDATLEIPIGADLLPGWRDRAPASGR